MLLTLLNCGRLAHGRVHAPPLRKDSEEVETTLRQLWAETDAMLERTRGPATHRMGIKRLRGRFLAAHGRRSIAAGPNETMSRSSTLSAIPVRSSGPLV